MRKEAKKNHKYLSRKLINGKYRYYYNKPTDKLSILQKINMATTTYNMLEKQLMKDVETYNKYQEFYEKTKNKTCKEVMDELEEAMKEREKMLNRQRYHYQTGLYAD